MFYKIIRKPAYFVSGIRIFINFLKNSLMLLKELHHIGDYSRIRSFLMLVLFLCVTEREKNRQYESLTSYGAFLSLGILVHISDLLSSKLDGKIKSQFVMLFVVFHL